MLYLTTLIILLSLVSGECQVHTVTLDNLGHISAAGKNGEGGKCKMGVLGGGGGGPPRPL